MKKTFKLTLADKEYEIEQISRGKSKEARYLFAAALDRYRKGDPEGFTENLRLVDDMIEVFFAYSPSLMKEREQIEDGLTPGELNQAVGVFKDVLFGKLLGNPQTGESTEAASNT